MRNYFDICGVRNLFSTIIYINTWVVTSMMQALNVNKVIFPSAFILLLLLLLPILSFISFAKISLILEWKKSLQGEVQAIKWHPNYNHIVAVTYYWDDQDKQAKGYMYFYTDKGGLLYTTNLSGGGLSVDWSPRELVAIGYEIYNSQDDIWEGGVQVFSSSSYKQYWHVKLKGWVFALDWSPKGDMLAVGTGGIDDKIYVYTDEGELLWSDEIGESVIKVSWSPDGKYIAIGTSGRTFFVYDYEGNLIWSKRLSGQVDNDFDWSPDGDLIAVGTNGGELYVYDRKGNVIWKHNLNIVWHVDWSSDGNYISVGTNISLNVFDRTGNLIWNLTVGEGVFNTQWSPDSKILAAGTSGGKLITYLVADDSYTTTNLDGFVNMVDWSPDTMYLAVGTDGHSLYLFKNPTISVSSKLIIKAQVETSITIMGPGMNQKYHLYSGQVLSLDLNPGEYKIQYVLARPNNMIGSSNALEGSITVILEPGKTKTVYLPNYNKVLGKIKLVTYAPTEIIIKWSIYSKRLSLDSNATLSFYAAPGYYSIEYTIEKPQDTFIGNQDVFTGFRYISVKEGQTTTIELPGYDDILGKIVIFSSDTSARVDIRWDNGYVYYTIKPGSNIEILATRGNYLLEYTLYPPPDTIGNPKPLIGNISITVHSGYTTEVSLPRYYDTLGFIIINTSHNIDIAILWEGGSVQYTLYNDKKIPAVPGNYTIMYTILDAPSLVVGDPSILNNMLTEVYNITIRNNEIISINIPLLSEILGKIIININDPGTINIIWESGSNTISIYNSSMVLDAIPGTYMVVYVPFIDYDYNILGNLNNLNYTVEINVTKGESTNINIPSIDKLLSLITINSKSLATVNISWNGGFKSYLASSGQNLTFKAVPGNYTFIYEIQEPAGMIGDPSVLKGSININVHMNQYYNVEIPSIEQILARLVISVKSPVNITLEWDGGSKNYVARGGVLEIPYVAPGLYTLRYKYLSISVNMIGNIDSLSASTPLYFAPGGTYEFTIPSIEEKIGSLKIIATEPTNVTIRWNTGVKHLYLDSSTSITLLSVPGLYTILYQIKPPEGMIGSSEYLKGAMSVTVYSNTIETVSLPGYEVLGKLVLRADLPAIANISWGRDSIVVNLTSGDVLEIPAAPGVYYVQLMLNHQLLSGSLKQYLSIEPGVASEAYIGWEHASPSLLSYLLTSPVITGLVLYIIYRVLPRVDVVGVEGRIIRGVRADIILTLANRGKLKWEGRVEVEIPGYEKWSEIVTIPGRSTKKVIMSLRHSTKSDSTS